MISIRITLLDAAAIHGYQGRLDFHGSLASPTSWTKVPGKPELKDLADRQAAVFWLIVPKGEPVPDTLTMHVQVEAIDSIETANATSVDSLAGQQVSTPFGAASLASVHPSGHSVTISLRPPAAGLGAGVKSLGPRIATLDLAGRHVVARASPGPDGTDSLVFDTASSATGSVALTLGGWTFDLPTEVSISVPASSCAAA